MRESYVYGELYRFQFQLADIVCAQLQNVSDDVQIDIHCTEAIMISTGQHISLGRYIMAMLSSSFKRLRCVLGTAMAMAPASDDDQ